ncbi:outer membrane protein [Legionella taurinensis]|uniref:Porin family protein n=2 Tax=Legionella taurinensis TaxID=70611 RepID=A0A3A5LTL7_9GAMM|nr:outer membrane beta-barrel protein [Legionella taurinensis]RJT48791.1 porin family protein [Legionella taurinensis]RJT69781.1 porin family protein [Legionella taurinensis]
MKRQLILFSYLCLVMPTLYSSGVADPGDKRFVFGLDAGAAKTKQLSQSAHFQLGYSTFNYLPDSDTSTMRYGISLGRRFLLNPLNSVIIGLSYHQFSDMKVRGTLQQGISPPLYSANYEYTIQLSQLLVDAKLQHQWGQRFYPYLTAGIGGGFNRAEHFYTTVPGYLTVTPTYANHRRSSLSYALGLGIDTLVAPHVTVGIGYLFSDLGRVGLGSGVIRQTRVSNYLSQSHLHMNTVLAQISWSI